MERLMSTVKPFFDLEDLVQSYQKQMKDEAYMYLQKRGITEETAESFRVGFESGKIGFYVNKNKLGGYFENRVIIPLADHAGRVLDLVGRSIDHREPKYKALIGVEDVFFNGKVLEDTEDVVLCNGLFDVMNLYQANIPAICVPNHLAFKEVHAEQLTDKRVFICLGNDEIGRRESVRIAGMLHNQAAEIYVVNLPESIRDVNDLFVRVQNPVDVFIDMLNRTLEEAMLVPIASDVRNITVFAEEFLKRHRGQVTGISSGFQQLDQGLFGGFRSGLYILAGRPSCGKSMLLKQMADHIAENDYPVVYVSWEMTSFELWARGIARILGVAPQIVLNGRANPDQVIEANKTYANISKMLWTLECGQETKMEHMAGSIERIIANIGKPPVVFIDDMIRIPAGIEPFNQHLSKLAHTFKQWSGAWNCPVITALPMEYGQVSLPIGLEASADVIMLMKHEGKNDGEGKKITLDLTKNRNGSLHNIPLRFLDEKAIFIESQ